MSRAEKHALQHALTSAPQEYSVALLIRHAERGSLPPDDVGYSLPLTERGREQALTLGALLNGRLRSLHSSPLLRCVQTAELLATGAGVSLPISADRLLGDPGVYVVDAELAWENWQALGHEAVMDHLASQRDALPGMASPDVAAHFLVQAMLSSLAERPGINVFVTHDSILAPTLAHMLKRTMSATEWPGYLEGACFWRSGEGTHTRYRKFHTVIPNRLYDPGDPRYAKFAEKKLK